MDNQPVLGREVVAGLRAVTTNLLARIRKLEALEPNPQTVIQGEALNDIVLTAVNQDVTGCSVTIGPGNYLIEGTFDFRSSVNANDNGQFAIGSLSVDGVINSRMAQANLLNDGTTRLRSIVTLSWRLLLTDSVIVKLVVRKSGGTGSSENLGGNTSMRSNLIAAS